MSKQLLILCLLLVAPAAMAQTTDKKFEFFAGYSNLQAEGIADDDQSTTQDDFFDRRESIHGLNVAGTGWFQSGFGLKGDFSWHRKGDTETVAGGGRDEASFNVAYFMAGPTVKLRNTTRVEPFLHGLVGGAYNRVEFESTRPVTGGTQRVQFETDAVDFAVALGGGLDIRVNDRFSIRAIQVDWAPIFFRDRTVNILGTTGVLQPFRLEGQRQDNIRIGVGIVF
jgi:opacity protein-like surface antigen